MGTCLLCTVLLSMLLLLLALMWWWWWPVDECYVDQMDWQYKWGKARQARCCARVGIGCKNQPTPEPGPVDPYNCADGYLNWKAGWSRSKKKWCCQKVGKGCPGTGGQNLLQARGQGYGAGAEYGIHAAPLAIPALGTS